MPIYKIPNEKKNGFQKYRVVVNYTDSGGAYKRIERRVYGLAQAKEEEHRLKRELENGPPEPKEAPLTISGLWERYKAGMGKELRRTTIEKKNSIIKTHVTPSIGKKPLTALRKTDLQEWRTEIQAKEIGVTMKNNAYKELRALLNYAVKESLIEKSPLDGIPLFRDPYAEKQSEKIKYYTKDEFSKYIAAAKEWVDARSTDDLWAHGIYIFFNLAYYTGMRKGEINALKWSDIENGNIIRVRRSISQKIKGTQITETPPKNQSSVRRLQMPAPLILLLDEHKRIQQKDKNWTEDYRVCGGPTIVPDTTLDHWNRKFAEAANLHRITIHDFRHSHASLLCNAGINIKEIARRLGHSNVEITWNTYSHLYPAEEERAIQILNEIK